VPDVRRNPGRLVDNDPSEAQPENRLRVVCGKKQDTRRAEGAAKFGADRIASDEADKIPGYISKGLAAALSDEVSRSNPGVIAGCLPASPV